MANKAEPQPQVLNIQHGMTTDKKLVVAILSQPVKDLIFTPAQAVEFCLQVLENAKECDPACVAGITWPPQLRKPAANG